MIAQAPIAIPRLLARLLKPAMKTCRLVTALTNSPLLMYSGILISKLAFDFAVLVQLMALALFIVVGGKSAGELRTWSQITFLLYFPHPAIFRRPCHQQGRRQKSNPAKGASIPTGAFNPVNPNILHQSTPHHFDDVHLTHKVRQVFAE
ncbi:MAG: hypothetical protein KGZ80_13415 [Methylomonas sp.]|nr:hypothetical protein [Methylomonas sp.]